MYNVPSVDDRNQESRILLVEECIANIENYEKIQFKDCFDDFFVFKFFVGFGVFANETTVHSRVRVHDCWH